MTDTPAQNLVAAAVAVNIVRGRRNNDHETPMGRDDQRALATRYATLTLAELGVQRDYEPSYAAIDREVQRRGGWDKQAQIMPVQFYANCLQCSEPKPLIFESKTARTNWVSTHATKTAHSVVQRWEMPTVLPPT